MSKQRINTETYDFPLSFAQERLWFLHQLEPDNSAYNIFAALQLDGNLNKTAMQQALDYLVQRHEILRTRFLIKDNSAVQRVFSSSPIHIQWIEKDHNDNQAQSIVHEAKQYASQPFNLSNDPLLRIVIYQTGPQLHLLTLTIHHIIADAWSMSIFVNELAHCYEAFCNDITPELAELNIQYADFSVWQREQMQGNMLTTEIEHWRQQLKGAPSVINLPIDQPRRPTTSYRAARERLSLSSATVGKAKQLASRSGASLYMVLLAVFKVLLARVTGQHDIVVGSLIANRDRTELEALIGFFVNTLVLRSHLDDNPNFNEFVKHVKTMTLQAYAHQTLPFEQLVDALQPERDLSYAPLVQTLFVMQNTPLETMALTGLQVTSLADAELLNSRFDLEVYMTENDSQLTCDFIYRTELFHSHTIRRLAHQYETLLVNALASPNTPIHQLSLMNHTEWQTMHDGWHWQAQTYPNTLCIHQLFEQQANKNPNQTAIIWQQQRISYAELNRHANQLAHYLIAHAITPETMVGICMERSIHMVISMLGILKAGAAYVPLDPNYPAQRMTHMLQDSGTRLVISQTSLLAKLPSDITTLQLDADGSKIAAYPDNNPQLKLNSHQLAYVIYTSGSTGLPKGVAIEHRSACALIHWSLSNYDSNELQAVLASTSICFDLSIYEIFVTLSHGGKIILVENALSLINRSADEPISLINTVPSAIATLLRLNVIPSSVTTINLAGEPLAQRLVEQLYQQTHVKKVYDLYGPSEDTTYSTYVLRKPGEHASIGRPITNTLAYVVDPYFNLVPEGIEGELLLGGHGLARGYLNQDSLTDEKFIANPFCVEKSARLYRTGDLVRYRQDGNLEYLGRIDQQVKVRGFRIELAEVQSVINSYPGVRENIVLVQTDCFESNALVAYVVPHQVNSLDTQDLLQAMSQRLAGYMIPSAIVILDNIPLTPNGKIDRKALPKPSIEQTRHECVAPRNATEQTLCQLWCKILNLSRIGIHDNFFQLGGHSLLATQIITHVAKELGITLPIRAVFEQPTIAGFTDHIIQKTQNSNTVAKQSQSLSSITTVDRSMPLPLSFAQQRLWFLSHIDEQQTTYNVHMCLRLRGALDSNFLQHALQQTIQRHEILRTTFTEQAGQPVQMVHPGLGCPLAIIDLSSLEDSQALLQAKHQAEQMSRQSFNLQKGPLFQINLLRFNPSDHLLVVVMHHIISDGWSLSILIHDVSSYYQAAMENISPELAPLAVQYGDFAVWHRQQWQPEQQQQQLTYWKKQLHNAPPVLMLPTDQPRNPQNKFVASSENFIIDSSLTEKILAYSQQSNASLFMVTLSAYTALLNLYSQQQDLVIGTPIANRTQAEVESLIGFFVNSLALRVHLPEALDFQSLVAQVKQTALDAYAHQDLPFEHIVEALQPERCLDQHPIFQTLFILQNVPPAVSHITSLTMEPFSIESHFSMFDLMCSVSQVNNQLHGIITYNATLFNKNSISRLVENYIALLDAAIRNPECPLDKLDLRSHLERKTLAAWNYHQIPISTNLVTLLERQCHQTPHQTALIDDHQSLSYQALNNRANQLAAWLNQQGLRADDKIALVLTRSNAFFITLFAALKIGASYVAIDPDYPQQRINTILNDCHAKLVLSDALLSNYDQHYPCYTMTSLTDELDQYSTNDENYSLAPQTIAYVLYTSGSTGTPKGVAMPHAALCNLVQWHIQHARLGQAARTLQFSAATFDVCFQEFATTLATGGTLILCPASTRHDPDELLTLLIEQRIERLYLPFVALQQLANTGNHVTRLHLKDVITAGEQLQITTPIKDFFSSMDNCQLHNHYGPTETHVVTAYTLADDKKDWPVLPAIGQPLPNVQLFILNRHQQPVPVGMPGEICIGGMCLAQGYLNQADMTAKSFTIYQVDDHTSIRLYHTGDLARWQADGNIEYLGRLDQQVKIRGFRVEPGEVEAALANHPQLRDVAVVARDDGQGLRLIGYFTTSQPITPDSQQLRQWLRGHLPEYMIPSHFVYLDQMPLASSGKINRRQLPAPCPEILPATDTAQPPQSPMEQILHQLWCELLEFTAIDCHANFFDLGGHSLLAMRLSNRIRDQLNEPISVRTVFEHPSIAQLATVIDNSLGSAKQSLQHNNAPSKPPALLAVERNQALPLSYAQEQLWFLDQLEGKTANYNMPFALQLTGNLDVTALQVSLNQLIDRHEILRTNFQFNDDQLTQHITDCLTLHIQYTDLCHQSSDIQQHHVESIADQEAKQPFDLQQDPLIRAQLLQLNHDTHILLITMHHIICDAWSIDIFTQELTAFYNSQRNSGIAKLSPLAIQYADYAYWQRQWLTKPMLENQLNYWQQQLANAPEFINLPAKKTVGIGSCSIISESLTPQLGKALVSFSRSQNATLYMTMLAGFSLLLQRLSGQHDLVIGTTMANRETPAIEPLIGFFVNALPIRLQLNENSDFLHLIQDTRQQVLDAHTHHTLPFEQLVSAIQPTRLANRHPIFQVMFNFQNAAFHPMNLAELSVEIIPSKRGASKYDLILSIINMGENLRCSFEYDSNQFSEADIQQYISFYKTLLQHAIEAPNQPIAELAIFQQHNISSTPSVPISTAKDAIEEFNF